MPEPQHNVRIGQVNNIMLYFSKKLLGLLNVAV